MPQTTVYVDFPQAPQARPARSAELRADHYTSAAIMAREWETLWTRTWLLAGLESDVREEGDFFVFNIGRESILIVRTESMELSAVYNVCQHRGNRIMASPYGSVQAIACPYHGWTYGLDGTLQKIPDRERFGNLDCAALSLKRVRVEACGGFVWVNMDAEAAPLATFLGPIRQQLDAYRPQDMRLVKDQTVCLDANWKTIVDNFSEQYHVHIIHAQHASFVDCYSARNELWPFGHRRVLVEGYVTDRRFPIPESAPPILRDAIVPLGLDPLEFRGRTTDIRKAVQSRKRQLGPELGFDYSALTDDQLSDIWQYDIFPNIIMTVKPEEFWIMRPRPHPTDPDRCFFDKWTIAAVGRTGSEAAEKLCLMGNDDVRNGDGNRPEPEVFTHDEVISGRYTMTPTIDQDIYLLREMQAGMHSRGFTRAVLNTDESRVQHFHDWMAVWLEASPLHSN